MASLIVLRRFWSSLANILKSSIDTVWPEMLIWSCIGEGSFRCSLNLSPKFLADSPIYSSSQSTLLHLNLYMTPLLFRIGSLSLGVMRRLISLLKSIKAEGGISETTYKKLYPTGATTPKYYWLPKVHKKDTPLRPIVSSTGSVAYETAKELSRILKPLVGRSTHHVRNNQDFIQSIEEVKVETSYI